jgi:multidrug efflux pump subunit AcrA (membrane-fusion protein)
MYVQLGDQVKQGQLIAQIDSIRRKRIKNSQSEYSKSTGSIGSTTSQFSKS